MYLELSRRSCGPQTECVGDQKYDLDREPVILAGLFHAYEAWNRPEALWHTSRVHLANRVEAELVKLVFCADFENEPILGAPGTYIAC